MKIQKWSAATPLHIKRTLYCRVFNGFQTKISFCLLRTPPPLIERNLFCKQHGIISLDHYGTVPSNDRMDFVAANLRPAKFFYVAHKDFNESIRKDTKLKFNIIN